MDGSINSSLGLGFPSTAPLLNKETGAGGDSQSPLGGPGSGACPGAVLPSLSACLSFRIAPQLAPMLPAGVWHEAVPKAA